MPLAVSQSLYDTLAEGKPQETFFTLTAFLRDK